jgi:hypothetical protein
VPTLPARALGDHAACRLQRARRMRPTG